ncbi:transcription factor BTF3 homolog 4-like [Convolutriloba macropyga]|uniref:transcription factor BTF3 homolog 4-like n=1 Tax=Convolutriloba macropyga TaxID=536237 RepID=UPI003F523215
MNADKLAQLQSQVRIGGKGSARRKRRNMPKSNTTDDKKLQTSLKRLGVNSIPAIEEVNMFKQDGTVIHFKNPKVQASLPANTFTITGASETKPLTEMLPQLLPQFSSPEALVELAKTQPGGGSGAGSGKSVLDSAAAQMEASRALEEEDEMPELVENFDEASKFETS